MAVKREETIKDLFKSFTGQEYKNGVKPGEGYFDGNTGILKASDGKEYRNDEIEESEKYFEERCRSLYKKPGRKKESVYAAIAYEAIKIMKGRYGSGFWNPGENGSFGK